MSETVDHIKDLKPDSQNARRHNPRNVGMIVNSLQAVGAGRSIVIDENDTILAGNATVEAAGLAGIEKVQVVEADGETIIAVRRRGLTPEQKTKLALFDNRTAELADWDPEVLKLDLDAGLDLSDLFGDEELVDLGALTLDVAEDPGAQIDKADELQQKWQVKVGDLWEIGQHRLLCGDSTKAEDVARVMQGEKATLCVMDPPYNISYSGANAWDSKTDVGALGPIANDSMSDVDYELFVGAIVECLQSVVLSGAAYYIFLGWSSWSTWWRALNATDMHVHNQIVWDKVNPKLYAHKPDFNAQHELIAYGWRLGAAHEFHYIPESDQQWSTIWRYRRLQSEDMVHVNEKPVELIKNAVALSSSANDVVIDLFLGGGSTMAACEQLGRKCRGIEISPAYCSVVLERMSDMGLEPHRTNT